MDWMIRHKRLALGREGIMDRWDIMLWAVAAVGCALALVRLMLRRRDQLYEEVQKQLIEERKRKQKAAPKAPLNKDAS
jgi:hypothetical protein